MKAELPAFSLYWRLSLFALLYTVLTEVNKELIQETHCGLYAAVRLANCHAGKYINPMPAPVLLLPTAHTCIKGQTRSRYSSQGKL
jgi:hypothetical protein